jgi:hypothetical protein
MESSGQRPPDPEVPLADAAIATEIANAAARGRGADRAPTLEQLLAAFGEAAPTEAARRRVGAALRVAGMGVRPDLMSAEPGERLMLMPPGVSGGKRSKVRALAGLFGVAAVLVAAAAGASLLSGDDGDGGGDRVADDLPSETTTATAAGGAPAATATEPAETAAATTETAAQTTATEPETTATATTDTTATTPEADAEADAEAEAAAERRRRRAARVRRQRQAAASKLVTVRVDATGRPTFLCVDDGSGKILFSGTLDGKEVFKSRRVRMNIGLRSTTITVNGNPVRLDGSPAGLDITRKGGARTLPSGNRPCG